MNQNHVALIVFLAACSFMPTAHGSMMNSAGQGGQIETVTFEVDQIKSYAGLGHPKNEVHFVDIGPESHLIGIGWDVTLKTYGGSWFLEMKLDITSSDQSKGITIIPGAGDNFGGTATYSSGGIIDLVGTGESFFVGDDGLLRLEFYELFVDFPNFQDGEWESGTLTFEYIRVPAPGSLALLLASGLLAARRRRRTAAL